MTGTAALITDEEVVGFVTRHLDRHGLASGGITTHSELIALGLDSITTVSLLISARDELVATGRLDASKKIRGLPPISTVGDLATLMRDLAAEPS